MPVFQKLNLAHLTHITELQSQIIFEAFLLWTDFSILKLNRGGFYKHKTFKNDTLSRL